MQPYSNREIDSHFEDIKETLKRIEEQTTKTNGRVSSLENWRWYVVGVFTCLLIVLPILYSLVNSRIERVEADHLKAKTIQK